MTDPTDHQKIGDWATLTPPGTLPVLDSIFQCSDKFLGQLKLWFEQHPPSTPITSILGFSQFTAQSAVTNVAEATSSATFVDLATVGPSLTLPNGKYVVFVQAQILATAIGIMGVSVNGAASSDLVISTGTNDSGFGATLVTLSAGTNTLVAKYRTNGTSTTFTARALIALRYSNS